MPLRYLTRWGWSALKRMGVTLDDIDVVCATTEAEHDAVAAAFEAAKSFANCLVNGLRIAGPSEPQ